MTLKFHEIEKRVMMANGISRQLIDHWEKGSTPSKKTALKVASITGRDLLSLLYGRNPGDEDKEMTG